MLRKRIASLFSFLDSWLREAINLLNFALYNDAEPQKKKKKLPEEKELICTLRDTMHYV